MGINLKQSLKLTHSLLMTPQLQQAIKLLQLSRVELEEFVAQQVSENPVIEDSYSNTSHTQASKEESAQSAETLPSKVKEKSGDAKLQEVADTPYMHQNKSKPSQFRDEYINYENFLEHRTTLQDHLIEQVREIDFSRKENEIATEIIGNITDEGYLDFDLACYVRDSGADIDSVEGVLDTIQRLEPAGIAARSLSECLYLQIRDQGLKNGVVERIVTHHLKDVQRNDYKAISKSLDIPLSEVVDNISIIAGLDPSPGSKFNLDVSHPVVPDVYVYKFSGSWITQLNDENLPKIKLNSTYIDMVDNATKSDTKNFLTEKFRSANWLAKSLIQRQKTILSVTECIVRRQSGFLDRGIQSMKPMVLRDVADEVGLHESTVSRVTTNKYVHTPQGIFELKFFFSSQVKGDNSVVSSHTVKSMIKEILSSEDPKRPLSDQKVVELLEQQKIHLARRTVAKYREQLGYLSSSKRRKVY